MESSAVSEIKRTSMQLTGLFARLQLKKMTLEEASCEIMTITDCLDKCAHWYDAQKKTLMEESKDLRLKNQKLHQEIYGLKEQIVRLEQQIDKQEKRDMDMQNKVRILQHEKQELTKKIEAFEEEESFLLDASIASDEAVTQALDISADQAASSQKADKTLETEQIPKVKMDTE